MDINVLDRSFNQVAIIDTFKSLLWVKRYYKNGEFELYVPAEESLLQYLQKDFVLTRDDDDTAMIIERVVVKTDAENGDYFIVSGRSLESILARRVILRQTVIVDTDIVQAIKQLVVAHTGNGDPSSYRAFPNFSIDDSLTVPGDFKAQYTGQNLLDTVSAICTQYGIGMKMTLSGANIVLSFYQGSEVDVIFSPEFDDLINSQYASDSSNYANYAIVAGQGEGYNRIIQNIASVPGTISGFDLREIWVDARDINKKDGPEEGDVIPQQEYTLMLAERGKEKLAARSVTSAFEAEVEPNTTFKYKTDYHLGDIVTVTNEYGITAKPRIVEIVESWDDTGYKVVPTFDKLEVQ